MWCHNNIPCHVLLNYPPHLPQGLSLHQDVVFGQEQRRYLGEFFTFWLGVYGMTARSSSSASLRSCMRLRSRVLISSRSALGFLTVPLLGTESPCPWNPFSRHWKHFLSISDAVSSIMRWLVVNSSEGCVGTPSPRLCPQGELLMEMWKRSSQSWSPTDSGFILLMFILSANMTVLFVRVPCR